MQVMSRRGSSSFSSSGTGGCYHGECTVREECCDQDSCARRHYFDKVVKDVMVVVVGIEN